MTWKALAFDITRAGQWAVKFLYPPTKKKLHRLLHVAGTALTILLLAATWLVSRFSLSERIVADVLVLTTYFSRWQVVLGKFDQVVDKLPIPEDDASLGDAVRANPQGPGTSA